MTTSDGDFVINVTGTDWAPITAFPWTENFNGITSGIPTRWDNSEGTTTNDSYKWSSYSTGHDGRCLRFESYSNSNGNTNFLKTPIMNLPSGKDMQLKFWYKNPTGGDFSVYISNDGGATYETALATGLTGVTDWTEKSISIPSGYTDNVVIVFKGTSNYGSGDAYIYLDDVTVQEQESGANFAINTDGSAQDFGSVKVNATAQKTYTITNNGNKDMFITITNPSDFTAALAGNAADKNVYFTDALNWAGEGVPNIHYWGTSNTSWPGNAMTYLYDNEHGQKVYYYALPDGVDGIIFNGGGNQTVNITDFSKNAYYTNNSTDGEGHYYFGTWEYKNCVPAGETNVLTVSMNTATYGDKSGDVVLAFDALNVTSFKIPCTGNVKDPSVLEVDFEDGSFPAGWQVGANWSVASTSGNYYAVQSQTSLANASAFVTTPLTFAENETLTFKVMRNLTGSSSYKKSLKVRYSTDGGVNWSAYKDYGDEFGASFAQYELTGVPAGTVIVEFFGNNIKIDDIQGVKNATKPALAVTEGTAAIANGDTKDFGFLNANGSATYTVKNIGNDVLKAAIAGDGVTVSPANIEVAAGETADITVTMAYAAPYGTKTGKMTIDSEDAWISDFVVNFTAELVDPTDFVEDFTAGKPAGWYFDTWTVSNGEASINVGTAKAMITEKIGAEEGKNTLSFDTKLAYDYGYGTYTLNVYTSTDRKNWGEAKKVVTLTNAVQHITLDALADGNYYVKFEAADAIIDNITGVKKLDAPAHDLYLVSATLPTDEITPLDTYSAELSVASLRADETVAAELYFGDTKVAELTGQSIANGATQAFTLEATGIAAGTYEVYAKVYNADASVETDKVSVTVADKTELAITEFEAIESPVQADNDNNFTAEFNVTVKNTGSTTVDAGKIGINIVDGSNDAAYANVTKTNETVFLAPGEYTKDNAKLFIYRWSTDTDSEWGEFTKLSDNLYSADLNGKAKFIVVRKASDATSGFDGAWNQSEDLTAADGICFTFQSWAAQKDYFTAGDEALIPNNATAKFKVTVTASAGDGGNMSFKAQEDVTSTYSSSATVIVKAKPATINVEMGAYGYTTFASAYSLDLSNLPAGLSAYKATVEGSSVKFTKLDQSVPANTGLLLKGDGYQGYSIPTASSSTDVVDNDFLVNDGTTVVTSDASNYIFVLKKNSDLEFVKYTGTAPLPSNKAYLNVPATNFTGGARLSVSFDDEVSRAFVASTEQTRLSITCRVSV